MSRQVVAHSEKEERHGEHNTDPKAPRHVNEFGALFIFEYTCPMHPQIADDLWMHRACVLDLLRWYWRMNRLQRHAALWTRARLGFTNFRMHRAGIFVFCRCALFRLAGHLRC